MSLTSTPVPGYGFVGGLNADMTKSGFVTDSRCAFTLGGSGGCGVRSLAAGISLCDALPACKVLLCWNKEAYPTGTDCYLFGDPVVLVDAPITNGHPRQLGYVKYGASANINGTPTTIPNPAAPNPPPAPPSNDPEVPPSEQPQNPDPSQQDQQQPPAETSSSPDSEQSQATEPTTIVTSAGGSSTVPGHSSHPAVIVGMTTIGTNGRASEVLPGFDPTPTPGSLPSLPSSSPTSTSTPSTPIIAGSIGGICAVLGAAALIFFTRRRKHRTASADMKTALPGYYSHPGPGQAGQPGFSNLPHSQASLAADPRSGHYGGEKQSGNTAYPAVNSNPGNSNGINNGLAGINYSGIQMNTTAGFGGDHGGFVNNNHQVARSNSSSSSSSSHSSGARSNTYSGNNTSMARTNSHAGSNNGNMDVYAANNTYARHNGHGANNMFANASPQSTPSYPTAVPHTATPYNEKSAMHQPNSSMWSATSSPSYAPDDSKRAMISASPVPEVMKKPEGEKAGWNGGAGVGSGKRDTVDMPPPPYLG